MQTQGNLEPTNSTRRDYSWGVGVSLIAAGIIYLLDQYLKTGWIDLLILPSCGIVLLAWGYITRRFGLEVSGSLLTGLGLGMLFALGHLFPIDTFTRIGYLLVFFALGWGLISLTRIWLFEKISWWPLIPGSILAGTGLCFLVPWQPFNFALFPVVGLGLVFVAWGLNEHLLGLIIPGSLLLGAGPGVYVAWSRPEYGNGLTQTGIMLVCFALGWGLITVLSRVMVSRFMWWPLIPGGILAMTGWGLYIGGSPQHALSFIGNTTSVSLILFGLYLLLWHSGLRK